MTFAGIPSGATVFVDANSFIYHFINHARYGLACTAFLERIEVQDVRGVTGAHGIGETCHRLMTIEACERFGWPSQGIASRLRKHPGDVSQLTQHRSAFDEISLLGIVILDVTKPIIPTAVDVSIQFGMLTNDALTIALMRNSGITMLASNDADFDRVPGIVRFAPA
jgi:uncharacterized protein